MISSQGHNLDSGISCGFAQGSDLTSTNPQLLTLADNGGPTKTNALSTASPAVDAGTTSASGCPSTNQRGILRPQHTICDIGAYEIVFPSPMVNSIEPNVGPVAGGTPITIKGSGFTLQSVVSVDGAAAINVSVNAAGTQLTATTTSHAAGTGDVDVTTAGGNGMLANGFTYLAAPTFSGVSPSFGPPSGGTQFTLKGTGFFVGASVIVDHDYVNDVVVVNSTTITAVTSSHAVGTVAVIVRNPDGEDAPLPNAFTFDVVKTLPVPQPSVPASPGAPSPLPPAPRPTVPAQGSPNPVPPPR